MFHVALSHPLSAHVLFLGHVKSLLSQLKTTFVQSHIGVLTAQNTRNERNERRAGGGRRFPLSITILSSTQLFLFFAKSSSPAMYQLSTVCLPLTILPSNNLKVSIHVLFPWKLCDQWLHIFPGQLWSVFCRPINTPVVDFGKVVDAETQSIH